MLNEVEATSFLDEGKQLVKLLFNRDLYDLTEADLISLQAVRRICKAGYIHKPEFLSAVGLSIEDFAMLLGTLTFHEHRIAQSTLEI
ncbi:MAG: hypothetical protein WCS37_15990 [Chloroflexota bacterium]|nr:hypothetical protein [Chloroflexota bacterium]